MHSKFPDPNLTCQIDLKISPQYCKNYMHALVWVEKNAKGYLDCVSTILSLLET